MIVKIIIKINNFWRKKEPRIKKIYEIVLQKIRKIFQI